QQPVHGIAKPICARGPGHHAIFESGWPTVKPAASRTRHDSWDAMQLTKNRCADRSSNKRRRLRNSQFHRVFLRSDIGDPGMTRTCDLRFRKPSLYPAELRDRID